MSTLCAVVRARIEELGKLSKEIAGAIHTRMEGIEDLRFSTLETRLSKLVNGDPDGWEFFSATPERLDALATVLEMTPDALQAIAARTVLVLHPDLGADVVEYVEACARVDGAKIATVRVASLSDEQDGRDAKVAVRDEFRRHKRAIAVVPNADDAEFLRGAEVRLSLVQDSPRGYVLEADPDLLPFPPLVPGDLWVNGEPHVACPELSELLVQVASEPRELDRYNRSHVYDQCAGRLNAVDKDVGEAYSPGVAYHLSQRVRQEYHAGREPTYSLPEIWPFWVARRGLSALGTEPSGREVVRYVGRPSRLSESEVVNWLGSMPQDRTVLWAGGSALYGAGPRLSEVSKLLSGSHQIETLALLDELPKARATLNPWRMAAGESPKWNALRETFRAELGVDIQALARQWLESEDRHPGGRCWNETGAQEFALLSNEEGEPIRRVLSEFARRVFKGDMRCCVTLPFRLERLSQGPLVKLSWGDQVGTLVVGDLGGGRVLRCLVRTFDEEPQAVRVGADGTVLDGGDIRVWMSAAYDEMLEGAELRPRRNEEKRAAARD
ncbi:MAG: hypothetical protein H6716_26425 [Polyangiaceae bacterium]|nr:hypothetical protein [Polyangiaceae bacterium]